jgi:hypothetical protein
MLVEKNCLKYNEGRKDTKNILSIKKSSEKNHTLHIIVTYAMTFMASKENKKKKSKGCMNVVIVVGSFLPIKWNKRKHPKEKTIKIGNK